MGFLDDVPPVAETEVYVESQACLPHLYQYASESEEQAEEASSSPGKGTFALSYWAKHYLEP